MKDNSLVLKRDETNIKFAPTWAIPVLFICMIAMVIMFGFAVFYCIMGQYIVTLILTILIVSLAVFGRLCDDMQWHRNVVYDFSNNDNFEYRYDLDKNIMPLAKPKVVLRIFDVKSYKCCNDKIIIKGNIYKRAPMSKPRYIKRATLYDIPEKHDEIIGYISKFITKEV